MKKVCLVSMALALCLLLCGCGDTQGTSGAGTAQAIAATPLEDFDYRVYDDYVELKGYHGAGDTIVIPGMIEGKPVEYVTIEENTTIRNVTVSEGTKVICSFKKCSNLETVILPSSIREIWGAAFSGTALKSINLPEGLEKIKGSAFINTNLIEITFPESLTSIGEDAFSGTKITEITVPAGMRTLGYAFHGCDTLKKITFTYTDENGFMVGAPNLEEVIIAEGNTSIPGQMFRDCKNLTTVTLPSTLTKIEDNAFQNCEKLLDLTIPEGVIKIGFNAFHGNTKLHVKAGSYAEQFCKEGHGSFYKDGHSNYVTE